MSYALPPPTEVALQHGGIPPYHQPGSYAFDQHSAAKSDPKPITNTIFNFNETSEDTTALNFALAFATIIYHAAVPIGATSSIHITNVQQFFFPMNVNCQHCHQFVQTRIGYETGSTNHFMAAILALAG